MCTRETIKDECMFRRLPDVFCPPTHHVSDRGALPFSENPAAWRAERHLDPEYLIVISGFLSPHGSTSLVVYRSRPFKTTDASVHSDPESMTVRP